MKQIKEEIKKIFEKNNINFLDYKLNDYLKEEQERLIREIIREENTLNIEYNESEINTIINKYELYNIEDLKQIIKKHFSKYNTEDLKKQLYKKINLNLDNYSKEKYFNLYNLNLKDLSLLYNKVMINYNKEIVLNHYCKTYYNNKIEEYKTKEFKNNLEKYLSLVFTEEKEENLKDYEINFYLNGKVKIRFKNKELHKQVYLFLTQETFKEITQEIYIKLNDYKEDFKPFVKRFTIYKTKEETEQIYINLSLNVFDYEKIKNIEVKERKNLDYLYCLIDISKTETKEDFYKGRIENLFKEITEEHNKNKVLKFLENIKN